MRLKAGDNIGIVCCSNGLAKARRAQMEELHKQLRDMGLYPEFSSCLYENSGYAAGSGAQRAEALMDFYRDGRIKAVFDVSGGDIANEILDLIDYNVIRRNPKPFFGYSDLTVLLNAMFKQTGSRGYLYQISNLAGREKERQRHWFYQTFFLGEPDLTAFSYVFCQGSAMEGQVVGGNARCFLKLAGTPYMPDMRGKILFLEARGGNGAKLVTEMAQLRQMGVLKEIGGILLGSFLEMEKNGERPDAEEIVVSQARDLHLPIARTHEIGHGDASKCLVIGDILRLS